MLSKRLKAIADLLPAAPCIADVGCDHGKLGLFLLQSGKCEHLNASDLSTASLEKAKRLYEQNGLLSSVTLERRDGLPETGLCEAAVIAGLGGDEQLRIIKAGLPTATRMDRLVLQPSDDAATLRAGLWMLGFEFVEETIVANGRFFPVIAVRFGEQGNAASHQREPLTDIEAELGPYNVAHVDAGVSAYAKWRRKVWQKATRTEAAEAGNRNQQTAQRLAGILTDWLEENGHEADA